MLRVLHRFTEPEAVDAIVAEASGLRGEPGCVSAEVYASLLPDEHAYALTMVWSDEAAYNAYWSRTMTGAGSPLVDMPTEFYHRSCFALRNDIWVPEQEDESSRAIFWPAAGAVRIIIQNAVAATPAMYDKIAVEIASTRREEGCLEYAWLENVDLPGHLLLLELWADQVVYDRHWTLRQWTAEYVGDTLRTPAEPQRGPVTREFYRHQAFRHHYDRWLPAAPADYATTIQWPAR